jgi:hypothetical protein
MKSPYLTTITAVIVMVFNGIYYDGKGNFYHNTVVRYGNQSKLMIYDINTTYFKRDSNHALVETKDSVHANGHEKSFNTGEIGIGYRQIIPDSIWEQMPDLTDKTIMFEDSLVKFPQLGDISGNTIESVN